MKIKGRGVFYNSIQSVCSIWESGKMCYDALNKSYNYTLDYSEDTHLDFSYDFAIFNHHVTVNNWMTHKIIKEFNKPTFCIVTEVTFGISPIEMSPKFFSHYIVLDPTIIETNIIHAFCRPLEDFIVQPDLNINYTCPSIFSFGFASYGKEWHKIVEIVENDYDTANIRFNIPKGTHIPFEVHCNNIKEIITNIKRIKKKPGVKVCITNDILSKNELIKLCSTQTINCFFYNRDHLYNAGLSAVTDQAISSGRPLFVTSDKTFRHISKFIETYPKISIKDAITTTQEGVLNMKKEWSNSNFLKKFESIII